MSFACVDVVDVDVDVDDDEGGGNDGVAFDSTVAALMLLGGMIPKNSGWRILFGP